MLAKKDFEDLHPWIDPTLGYPESTLRAGVRSIKDRTFVAIKHGGAHKAIEWMSVVHSDGLEKIDGHEWEMFDAHLEDDDYIWGMFVEGIGAINVMVPKEYVRSLTDDEKKVWSGRKMVMSGSHSGNTSYGFTMPVID